MKPSHHVFVQSLETPFTEDEILKTLLETERDKAPRPIDFPFKFAQFFWNIFKRKLIRLFLSFQACANFNAIFSKSLISLISTIKSLVSLNNFRLISFLGQVHKLVARVLTTRLRLVIDKLVRHTQTDFIRGHNIYDGWIIASQVLDAMKDKHDLIFKLKFEKAYDRVN